jgi:hypothetical protein
MPFSIYLDDCSDDDYLINLLRHAGYVIVSPRDGGTLGWDDADHLEYATQHGHALLTHDPQDFQALHNVWQSQGRQHPGLLLVYQDNDSSRDMTANDIVRALENLLASGLPIVNTIHTLNHWR